MNRRSFLERISVTAGMAFFTSEFLTHIPLAAASSARSLSLMEAGLAKQWLATWEKSISGDARSRYCDKEMGEELGWLMSPFLNGFYYGYLATGDPKWAELLIDWTDSWIKRGVKEPDGYTGWPKGDGGGGESKAFTADSLLGESMALRPVVLMADRILRTPELEQRWAGKARSYLELADQTFRKWDSRGCWREVKGGGAWVVPGFGVDLRTGQWSSEYDQRKTAGFSNPANKQNHIARWLLAMYDVTKKPVYKERGEQWFRLMKSRMRTREGGKYFVWNYWDPAGPWDYKGDGSPKHWVGIHPNGGYYAIDAEGIVAAFEHDLVFTKEDIDRLVATNRDFMWNQQMTGAKFQRIDGEQPDPRWKNSPGLLWTSLIPYDETLRKIFLANHNPGGWGGLGTTPWFIALSKGNG